MINHARRLMKLGDTFIAYCDGSALGTPGAAAYAFALFRSNGGEKIETQGVTSATNIEMEMAAAEALLGWLDPEDKGAIHTDSQHVVKGITEWRASWQAHGWKTAKGKPVAHLPRWQRIFALVDERPNVRFEWVKGHAGDVINEHVDELARRTAEEIAGIPRTDPVIEKVGQLRALITARPETQERGFMLEALDVIETLAK